MEPRFLYRPSSSLAAIPTELSRVRVSVRARVRRVTIRLAVYCQPIRLGDKPLETHDKYFYFPTEHFRLQSFCNILSDERMGLSFTIAANPRQRRHSQDRVPRVSRPYFTVSVSRLPKPRGPGPRIYIPQELGSLFVASYYSQGYCGGIQTRLHTGFFNWAIRALMANT
jgi:hypothetical protein